MENTREFTRSEKILLSLFILSKGTSKKVRFEDIAVKSFKIFRSDFQLRGYPNYPDTGDIIHKPLYSDLKKKGLVLSGGKYFSLTKKGLEYGKKLKEIFKKGDYDFAMEPDKYTKSMEDEINRIIHTSAFNLFASGKKDEILDIDFHDYLGTTVRTKKFDFLGRLNNVKEAVDASKSNNPKLYIVLNNLNQFLLLKFSDVINYFENMKGGKS